MCMSLHMNRDAYLTVPIYVHVPVYVHVTICDNWPPVSYTPNRSDTTVKGINSSATQQCNMSPYFYAIDWSEKWRNSQFSVCISQKMQLTGQNLHNEHA